MVLTRVGWTGHATSCHNGLRSVPWRSVCTGQSAPYSTAPVRFRFKSGPLRALARPTTCGRLTYTVPMMVGGITHRSTCRARLLSAAARVRFARSAACPVCQPNGENIVRGSCQPAKSLRHNKPRTRSHDFRCEIALQQLRNARRGWRYLMTRARACDRSMLKHPCPTVNRLRAHTRVRFHMPQPTPAMQEVCQRRASCGRKARNRVRVSKLRAKRTLYGGFHTGLTRHRRGCERHRAMMEVEGHPHAQAPVGRASASETHYEALQSLNGKRIFSWLQLP